MLKRFLTIGLCLALAGVAFAGEPGQGGQRRGARAAREGARARQGEPTWRLAIQLYTFNRFPFMEAVDKAKSANARYVEGFAWQKIGGSAGDAQLNPAAPKEAIDAAKKKLQDADITMPNYYVGDFGKTDAERRKMFEFAREMGIRTFVCEPSAEQFEALTALAREFRINLAIHNHPKDAKKADYRNWDPKYLMEAVSKYGRRLGFCADTGHWGRSGVDPVEGLKTYGPRLIALHLKDLDKKAPEGKDVVFGTGVNDVKAQLQQLKQQKFSGVIAIEYEANMENNVDDVSKCLDFIRKAAEEMGQKVE